MAALNPTPSSNYAKTLIVGAGGAGSHLVTYASDLVEPGEPTRCLALDVQNPPIVERTNAAGPYKVQLTEGLDFVRIGVGMNPSRAAAVLERYPGRRPHLAKLLARIGGRAHAASFEIGTEAQRLLGYAAFEWSRLDVDKAVERALRGLNDVRLTDGQGDIIVNAPVNVLVACSLAGGVGSAVALPLTGLVKGVMHRIGIDISRSLFTQIGILADAFPANRIREANAWEALSDLELSQKKGVVLWD